MASSPDSPSTATPTPSCSLRSRTRFVASGLLLSNSSRKSLSLVSQLRSMVPLSLAVTDQHAFPINAAYRPPPLGEAGDCSWRRGGLCQEPRQVEDSIPHL